VGVVPLLGAALALFILSPWHGPIVLALSASHGIDAGDLPALALLGTALAVAYRRTGRRGPSSTAMRRWAAAGSAVVLGGLLLAGVLERPDSRPLLPAGGGTFNGLTAHTDGSRADPLHRWSHLAVTYDGEMLRLFIDGSEVSSRPTSGSILKTSDPLWIGGNHPYGEYFNGLIDEVRIYDRALNARQIRAEMGVPIRRTTGATARDLVAAWAFDGGSGRWAADASGSSNRGVLAGASWTAKGRFGDALRFDGAQAVVRVPASRSLNLTDAMTLSAWIRPAAVQAGWRTVLAHQTDAYFLMAGGGETVPAGSDAVRISLLAAAALCFCLALLVGRARWLDAAGSWWAPVALFLAGSVLDSSLASPGSVIGPYLVALWYAFTARRRTVAVTMFAVAVVLAGVTIAALAGHAGPDLARDDGGVARSAALGLVLVIGGMLAAHQGRDQSAEGVGFEPTSEE
jgi:Concanavalin A-like lectin/glucanases superfamily